MANYGMENLPSFAQTLGNFGNIQYFLHRDMGPGLPFPELELQTNLGLGEVCNPTPPISPISEVSMVNDGVVTVVSRQEDLIPEEENNNVE